MLDTWTLFADADGNAQKDDFPDLLHPNQLGYTKWKLALQPILATLGFLDNEPDDFEVEEGFESLFNGRDLTGWGYRPTSEQDANKLPSDGKVEIPTLRRGPSSKPPSTLTANRSRPTAVTLPRTVGWL